MLAQRRAGEGLPSFLAIASRARLHVAACGASEVRDAARAAKKLVVRTWTQKSSATVAVAWSLEGIRPGERMFFAKCVIRARHARQQHGGPHQCRTCRIRRTESDSKSPGSSEEPTVAGGSHLQAT